MVIWSILWPFGLFYGHLVYFMGILVYFMDIGIFSRFGILYQKQSGNPASDATLQIAQNVSQSYYRKRCKKLTTQQIA
jgi:hypothetical protein